MQRQTVEERPKLSSTRDTLSVLGHTGAVIGLYILFHRVTKYILYRFKVTGSLRFASNLQYPPSHPLEALYYAFCVRLSLDMFCFEPDTGLIQMQCRSVCWEKMLIMLWRLLFCSKTGSYCTKIEISGYFVQDYLRTQLSID